MAVKLTVFGASGPTGKAVVETAIRRGHTVTAAVESTAPASRFPDSVRVVEANVYEGSGLEAALEDATAVCNLLQHSKRTPADYVTVGGSHILDAMESAGVDRYLTVVPATVQTDGDRHGIGETIVASAIRLLKPTVAADADTHVEDITTRDLDWTVIRVLRTGEGRTTRQYQTGNVKLGVGSVSYGDVAAFLLDCCDRGIYLRMQPKIRT